MYVVRPAAAAAAFTQRVEVATKGTKRAKGDAVAVIQGGRCLYGVPDSLPSQQRHCWP